MFICCRSIATTGTTALIGLLAVILLFAFADLIAICRNMCLNKREASEDAPLTLSGKQVIITRGIDAQHRGALSGTGGTLRYMESTIW